MSVASLIVVVYNQTVDDVPVIKAALNAFVRPEILSLIHISEPTRP